MNTIVIVESPAKAKTINKYLGKEYEVLASYGHIRDLPSRDGSVNPDEDFAMHWEADAKSARRMTDLARKVKEADRLILATDPDREGEAISWHILEVLRKKRALAKTDIQRVAFNAITRKAVLEAIESPRQIDESLVDAYLARRALDYLVGFTLSPVLWRKLPGSRSAGRVQSVALRLVCDREAEIERFVSREYWDIHTMLATGSDQNLRARLVSHNGKKLGKFDIPDEATARQLEAALADSGYKVASIEKKPQKRNPAPPFTTSTLQQEASRKLGFSSSHTMRVAQGLYEGVTIGGETVGLITYMRTDAVQMAAEGISACRDAIGRVFGDAYLPETPRAYKTKAKNAQEAHEAIRPTDFSRQPKQLTAMLDKDQARLYELIWNRATASQMNSALFERTTIDIEAAGGSEKLGLRASGSVQVFDGFLKLYQEGRDEKNGGEADTLLPRVSNGEALNLKKVEPAQHFTEPPPRYSEASLIKRMEELGIGRPSTYTSTLTVLRDRGYVRLEKRRLVPEDKGRLVTSFLENFFERYVEYDFTADLESKLDRISNGEINWKEVLRDFWTGFLKAVEDIKDLRVSEVLDALNEALGPHVFPPREDGGDPRQCPSCENGKLSLKVGRFGAFVGCSNYPECNFTRQLVTTRNGNGEEAATNGPVVLGVDPETGAEVTRQTGRFGPYVQRAAIEKGEKPKRASLPKGLDPDSVDLEMALKLINLPREIGPHPETGKPVTAAIGRYGPYVHHESTYANLKDWTEVFDIGLNRAVSLIADKKNVRSGPETLKELGPHPEDGEPVNILSGRYGPYVKHKRTNASLPKDAEPETLTMEAAVELLAARAKKAKTGRKTTKRTTKAKTKKPKPARQKPRPPEPGRRKTDG
jgi:DNA topoisomerase-1